MRELDFTILESIKPYEGDYSEKINEQLIEQELFELCREIDSIDIRSIPFDKWDIIIVFSLAILEVSADFLLGDPKKGPSKEMSDKNSGLGKYFNSIHEDLDHTNNPLDFQGKISFEESAKISFGGGDHRARTFGHDLFMFPFAIYQLCKGEFIDGGYRDKVFQIVTSTLNAKGNPYVGLPFDQAIVSYVIHMVADFFSTKSLPIPGFGILAHLPDRDIRKMAADMYSDGFNLRHMIVQSFTLLPAEILTRCYVHIRFWNSIYTNENKSAKIDKMLLMTHSIATAVNIGKVIITKNPSSINLPMILRVFSLCWKVIKDDASLNHRSVVKANLSVIKNKLEVAQTLILLDKTVYYTSEINRIISRSMHQYDTNRLEIINQEDDEIQQFHHMLDELKRLNT